MKNYVNKLLTIALLGSSGAAFSMEKPTITMKVSPSQAETFEQEKAALFDAINKSSLALASSGQTKEDQIAGYAREIENLFNKAADKKALANALDAKGSPALHKAIQFPRITEILIKNGANYNALVNNNYPIFRDVMYSNNIPTIKQYLRQGDLNLNYADAGGLTPLHLAVSQGPAEAAFLLIEAGADVNAKTKTGQSVLFFAKMASPRKVSAEDKAKIIQMLKDKGAQE
jgi:ankyrin repeat protein